VVDGRIERGKNTRARLIAAGRELFGKQGYDATSTAAILEKAGIARGALYHHFASKEELFDAVLQAAVAEMAGDVTRAAREAKDPVEALRVACRAWLELALDPALQRISLIDAPAVVGWSRWRELDEQHSLGALRANLRAIAEEGRIPAERVDFFAHMIIASVTEAALVIVRADDQRAAHEQAAAAVDAMIDGLIGAS
jgi:AcrR family transcriptional regulator